MNVYLVVGFLGIALQVCVLHLLIRGAYRQFPGIAVYLAVLFLTAIADATVFVEAGLWPVWYQEYYYLNNTVRHLAGFAALVSLVFRASNSGERHRNVLKISLASLLVISASALLAHGTWPNEYMNEASRNLSFATVLLNVALWLTLAKNRTRDTQLFLVSGGLGLNMAGEAVAQSLLRLSVGGPAIFEHAGNIVGVSSHILCLLIWWKAFRQPAVETVVTEGVPTERVPVARKSSQSNTAIESQSPGSRNG